MKLVRILWLALAAFIVTCASDYPEPAAMLETTKEFVRLRTDGNLEHAEEMLSSNPRLWYESRSGPGRPWELRSASDSWFRAINGRTTYDGWEVDGKAVTAHALTTTTYDELLGVEPYENRLSWFFDSKGKITGFLVVRLNTPDGSEAEFQEWLRDDPRYPAVFDSEGNAILSTAAGKLLLKLAREWRATTEEVGHQF